MNKTIEENWNKAPVAKRLPEDAKYIFFLNERDITASADGTLTRIHIKDLLEQFRKESI